MASNLPARPDLEHLRRQAKTLLAQLNDGDASAARTFMKHLPEARGLTAAKVRSAGFRLADAQSAIARKSGFDSWPLLSRHVQQLRLLEGDWHFVSMQVDGKDIEARMFAHTRLLIDGDRFRTESPEGIYDGVFTIDVGTEPMRIDIEFVEGPEAGNHSYGLFDLNGDQLVICLGLAGASRPVGFSTKPGSGHALERLRRASAARPAGVSGGKPAKPPKRPSAAERVDTSGFDVDMTPLLRRLEGEWDPVQLVMDGEDMRKEWLAYGSRVGAGNEMKVVFNGQVMAHAKMRFDERTDPVSVDYLNLAGSHRGKISFGIMEWKGDHARFLIASPGLPRPASFSVPLRKGVTLSEWKRRG